MTDEAPKSAPENEEDPIYYATPKEFARMKGLVRKRDRALKPINREIEDERDQLADAHPEWPYPFDIDFETREVFVVGRKPKGKTPSMTLDSKVASAGEAKPA